MATTKVKGTSKKIKELKGIKPEKITDEQLTNVQNVINEINRTQMEVGQIEAKKHAMMHHISVLQESVGKIKDEFEKDYGTDNISLQDGTISYPETNVENGEVNKKD